MPQMSPLNWSILFMYFLTLMMMIFFKIYFTGHPKNTMMNNDTLIMDKNMKWQW